MLKSKRPFRWHNSRRHPIGVSCARGQLTGYVSYPDTSPGSEDFYPKKNDHYAEIFRRPSKDISQLAHSFSYLYSKTSSRTIFMKIAKFRCLTSLVFFWGLRRRF